MRRKQPNQKALIFIFDEETNMPAPPEAVLEGLVVPNVSVDAETLVDLANPLLTALNATKATGWYVVRPSAAETDGDELLFSGLPITEGSRLVVLAQRYSTRVEGNIQIRLDETQEKPQVNVKIVETRVR